MQLADTNVWLALAISQHDFHKATRDWLSDQLPPDGVCFCRSTQQSFLRLLTTAAVFTSHGLSPLSNAEAWSLYEQFLADDRITFANEPSDLNASWKTLSERLTASPKLWMDAYLAAFAISGGYQLVTTDIGFRQYAGLDLLVLSKS